MNAITACSNILADPICFVVFSANHMKGRYSLHVIMDNYIKSLVLMGTRIGVPPQKYFHFDFKGGVIVALC